MPEHFNAEGVPLRGDGTPFPEDPSQWTPEERAYLEQYYFTADMSTNIEHEQVTVASYVPEINQDGGAYA